MFRLMVVLWAASALAAFAAGAHEPVVLHVYGPGGPAPAMREAAKIFGQRHGIEVKVTAGPVSRWARDFQSNGDVIYSGSENMMSAFVERFPQRLDAATVQPLYLRPAAILVRPGNPRHIQGFADLLKPGMHVLVVHGAGQIGMWEDIAGADGDIRTIRTLRSHIAGFARNSAAALARWNSDKTLDAWIIFPIWARAHPGVAEVVPLSPHYRIYRDCGVAQVRGGAHAALARAFVKFLAGEDGRRIFVSQGWTDHAH